MCEEDVVADSGKIRQLHHAASDLMTSSEIDGVYQTAIDTAQSVLEFEHCRLLEHDQGQFRVVASSHREVGETIPSWGGETTLERSHRHDQTIIARTVSETTGDVPSEDTYRSGISVPITDTVVLQALSSSSDEYTEQDRELAELLGVHTSTALEQIRSQKVLTSSSA